ncbi:hypothetical protein [Streptomyces sp. NRRL S-378]|uniref:hypothetical protein n=1 Tax=Streptomyces sp. NRRL S-378 TaxID=1463904 RepID=UPI00131BB730|nr:hypothetical protein [Streptomyces sp. NRRL S-378]
MSRSPGLHSPEGREHLVQVAATIGRLRGLTASGDFAYFVDVAHFTAGPPLPGPSALCWTESEEHVRSSWRRLVEAR